MANTFEGAPWKMSYSAQQLQNAATNQVPRINPTNNHWEVWNINTQTWVDTGVTANPGTDTIGDGSVTAAKLAPDVAQTLNTIMETAYAVLAELKGQRPKRYGFRCKRVEGAPVSRIEYLYDAVGMTPAYMDYTTGTFNYGDWKDLWFVRDNYACMLKSNGVEDYKLKADDYTLKDSDGTASDVANTAYDGNAMSNIPLVWVKRYEEGGYSYTVFCEFQYDESYEALAHICADGSIGKLYLPTYKGSYISNKCRSLSGQRPGQGQNGNTERTYCKANGSLWDMRDWASHELIADLLFLMGKSCNTQAVFGQGNTTSGSAAEYKLDTGTLNDKGQFYGSNDTTHQVKVFHMEGFWGDRWDRILGLLFSGGNYLVKMTPEGNGYNFTGEGYHAIEAGVSGSATGNGWQRDTRQTRYGRFPIGPFTGSDATFETDYFWWNSNQVDVALVGGSCINGSGCGARSLDCDSAVGLARWNFGASPSCKVPS